MELTTQVFINGQDISDTLQNRILYFEIIEYEGLHLDTLELEIDNADNAIIPPSNKAVIELALGFDTPYPMGKYVVNFVNNNNGVITLRAAAQDLQKGRVSQNRVFEQQTLSAVLNTIASSLGLTLQLDPTLATTQISYLLQANQSDLSLLAELGELYYAVASVKDNKLVFMAKDSQQTPVIITDDIIQYINKEDSEYKIYNGAKSYFWDTKTATRQDVTLGSEAYLLVPSIYGLPLTQQLVKSKYKQIKEQEIIELTLQGSPQLQAGLTIMLSPTTDYQDFKGTYKIKTTKHIQNGENFNTFITAYKLA